MKKLLYLTVLLNCISVCIFGQNSKLQLSVNYSHTIIKNFTGDSYKEQLTIGSENTVDTVGSSQHNHLNGFGISGAYRLSDHLAAKVSFGWYTGSATNLVPGGAFGRGSASQPGYILIIPAYTNHSKLSNPSATAGVEYKDFKSANKLNPFGHLLVGLSFENASYNLSSTSHAQIYETQNLKVNTTAFTIDAGAGLDLKLNKNFDLRIIQIDFVPTFPGKKNIQKSGRLSGPYTGSSFPNDQLYQLQTVTTNNSFQANFRFGAGVVFTPNL